MKYLTALLIAVYFLATPVSNPRAEDAIKRRPDQVEFVTEGHVRLKTESLTIAEIKDATPVSTAKTSFWVYLRQSFTEFVQAVRSIFN